MANNGETMETVTEFIFLSYKITADGDCSHQIKRHLLLGRKAMTKLESILKSRNVTFLTKVSLFKAMVFPVVICGYESWTVKKTESSRIDAFELWFWRRLLRVPLTARRLNQSILKGISPEYSWEGLMLKLKLQHFGHPVQDSWMASITQWTWVEQALGDGEGWKSLACCSPWGHKEIETTTSPSTDAWIKKNLHCMWILYQLSHQEAQGCWSR